MTKKKGQNRELKTNITSQIFRTKKGNNSSQALVLKDSLVIREARVILDEQGVSDGKDVVKNRENLAGFRNKKVALRDENYILKKKLKKTQKELAHVKMALLESERVHLQEANQRLLISAVNAQKMQEAAELATLEMAHMAQHDFLTGLPNRSMLKEQLSQAIGLARRHGKQIVLMFLDLDHFKHINDSLGHSIGDELLQLVGRRLTTCVRSTDTICRFGGDEFIILLTEISSPQAAVQVSNKIHTAFTEPFIIDKNELYVNLSIGISIYPDDSVDPDVLIQNADTAMYNAKETGRNHFQFFKVEMNEKAVRRMFVETGLRRALIQKEFVLYYQPKINLVSGKITGSEALIRWVNPELGIVYPDEFIQIAEESHLILSIDRWVMLEACKQVKKWLDSGLSALPVAVNVSAVNFRNKHFLENIILILEKTGLPPDYLELELTESILMDNAESSVLTLKAVKDMGIKLAIDDFGVGFSSLSYIRQFPIDTLKIDRSFVDEINSNKDNAAIVSAVIGIGKNLNQRVIAEGVETPEQLSFLQAMDCDEGQGFHFNHPMLAEDFTLLLETERKGQILSNMTGCL
ncbi:MAG: EAL domain-containing protein [Desulforegulaceae bacterium]|nr:EAL domain-containing protein [Desulforegulaceae bacterium]